MRMTSFSPGRSAASALVAILVLVSSSAFSAGGTDAAATGYATQALVDVEWLQNRLDDPDLRVIDVSRQESDYAAGHIPGAVYVALSAFSNPADPVRGQIGTAEQIAEVLSAAGVEPDDTVVLYDNLSNLLASRAYWALAYYQHADIRILNGGIAQWRDAEGTLATGGTQPAATRYPVNEADPAVRTNWQYVMDHIDDPNTLFCDTRSQGEHLGTDVRAARGGTIPGSINVDWSNAVNTDGTFKSARQLERLYTGAGFPRDKEIITYCQTGVRGAHTWFVLSELLGYASVRNYDGSWEEYGNREDSRI